jgi:23S rRNA pseudouridine1911/1915/1917 synthase
MRISVRSMITVMKSFAELLDVLYEDNHLLALNKPAGWPTTHFDGKTETLDRLAKSYLKEKYHKPGNVFLGVVHRIDKPTTGVVLFARTSKAAARLSEQFREGAVEKTYWAVVQPRRASLSLPDTGSLDDYLWHDNSDRMVYVVPADMPGAQAARVVYLVRARDGDRVLLELKPHTGRKHQLRVQLSNREWPILGDVKYGSSVGYGNWIALHARSLTVLHPVTSEPITLTADVPRVWRGRFATLLQT